MEQHRSLELGGFVASDVDEAGGGVVREKRPTPFLDYYADLGFVPTRQGGDHESLRRRREELYLRLGLPPGLFRGSDILEFGPGSGENSGFTASLQPRVYRLVDGFQPALEATRRTVEKYLEAGRFTLTQATIDEFQTSESFDIVLCEGLLPFQADPTFLVRKIAQFVRPGGVLVVTCADPVSMLPESLRRYLARQLVARGLVEGDVTDFMVNFFEPDLDALPGMTRHRHDWVVDQLMHPWTGKTFSISDSLKALALQFRPTGASPSVFSDWRWYKDYETDNQRWVELCLEQLDTGVGHLLDNRKMSPLLTSFESESLRGAAERCYELVCEGGAQFDESSDAVLKDTLSSLLLTMKSLAAPTRASLESFLRYLNTGVTDDLHEFRSWWGRGQQYVALTRTLESPSTNEHPSSPLSVQETP